MSLVLLAINETGTYFGYILADREGLPAARIRGVQLDVAAAGFLVPAENA